MPQLKVMRKSLCVGRFSVNVKKIKMEQNAKQLLKRISEEVSSIVEMKISQVAHAPKENEWRAYIWQSKPHWEDIAWRVKEPNVKGISEVHLGFYSAKPSEGLQELIDKTEVLSKGKVSHIIKNDNGIRLAWSANLNDKGDLEKIFGIISNILPPFFDLVLELLCKNSQLENESESLENLNNEDQNSNDNKVVNLPSSVPYSAFEKIQEYYNGGNIALAEYLKEVIDKYGFDYGGWIYSCSYEDIFDELENVSSKMPELNDFINSSIVDVKNGTLSEQEKWFEAIKVLSNKLNQTGGSFVTSLTPNGGSDYGFLLFLNDKLRIPVILLYHFNETLNNASGWFDEFIEDYNIDYNLFLENNQHLSTANISTLEYQAVSSPFGITVDSNVRTLNVTNEIYKASLTGMLLAKEYC